MKENVGSAKHKRMCITVLGSSSVGKTALTVQYLTGRYIGDYYSGTDMTYRHSIPYLGGSLSANIDILDVSRPMEKVDDGLLFSGKMNAFLVVYSLTDSRSFTSAKEMLSRLPLRAPKYLVANQLDLQHRRQVTRIEGQTLANHFRCPFNEFSAAEIVKEDQHSIKVAFQKLIRQLIHPSINQHQLKEQLKRKKLRKHQVAKEKIKERIKRENDGMISFVSLSTLIADEFKESIILSVLLSVN